MTVPLKPRKRSGDPATSRTGPARPAAALALPEPGRPGACSYTDGLWTCEKPPSAFVLAMLGTAVDPDELDAAVTSAVLCRPGPPLTFGQQGVLEALSGFDDADLVAAPPHIYELLRDHRLPADH